MKNVKTLKSFLILNFVITIILGIVFFNLMDIPFGILFNLFFFLFGISVLLLLFLLTLRCFKSSKIGCKFIGALPALLFLVVTFVTVIVSFILLSSGPIQELTNEEWTQDFNHLVKKTENHPGFKSELSKEEFHKITKEIKASIPAMTNEEVTMEFYRLCASFKDAHTFPVFPGINLHNFPLRIFRFEEGWYIIDAGRDYKDLIGKKILKIGSTDIETIFRIHSKYISAESRTGRFDRFTYIALIPEWLKAQGYISDTEKGIFTLENKDGEHITEEIKPINRLLYLYWGFARAVDIYQSSVFGIFKSDLYKIEILEESKTLYIQCIGMDPEISEFSEQITEFLKNHSFERCIIDLRNNVGGNDINDERFIDAIKNNPLINQRGKLFVLIGRYTFSSGVILANKLQLQTKAIFIGEPTAQGSAFYANPDFVTLPNSNMIIPVSTTSTTRTQPIWAFETGTEITPDIEVKYTHKDYLAGKDPAIEAAIVFDPAKTYDRQVSRDIIDEITGRYILDDFHIMEIKSENSTLSFTITDFVPESDFLVTSDLYLQKNGDFETNIFNVFVQLPTDTNAIGSEIGINWMGQEKTLIRAPENFVPTLEAISMDAGNEVKFHKLENFINGIGYDNLREGNINKALELFKLNVNLFPDSYNTFDSYAEALLKSGDKEAAIINYKRSVDLNPGHENGKRVLKELGVDYSE